MKAFAPCAAALILGFQLPAQAHTAVQKWIESDLAKFNKYVYCHENFYVEDGKALSCKFDARKHVDHITVHCEDGEHLFLYSDSQGKERVGATFRPAFTVVYFSSYHGNAKWGDRYSRGPMSPWAVECRRIYPEIFY